MALLELPEPFWDFSVSSVMGVIVPTSQVHGKDAKGPCKTLRAMPGTFQHTTFFCLYSQISVAKDFIYLISTAQ